MRQLTLGDLRSLPLPDDTPIFTTDMDRDSGPAHELAIAEMIPRPATWPGRTEPIWTPEAMRGPDDPPAVTVVYVS